MSFVSENIAKKSFNVTASYAMQLSLTEIGLGSLLHAFHAPFSGFFLSLNQCLILNRCLLVAKDSAGRFMPLTVSNTAAIIKTLSPYGKKFTPMLAISMQGLLFNIGVILFGRNLFGRLFGSFLLSLWPMMQPLLVYGIIYGSILSEMSAYYENWNLFFLGYVFLHIGVTLGVCFLTQFLPARVLDRYDRYITQDRFSAKMSQNQSKLKGVWRDISSPFFLFSLILSGFFFYATRNSLGSFFFAFFRVIAMALLTFYVLRIISGERCVNFLTKSNLFKKYTPYVENVLNQLQKKTNLQR